MEFLKIECFYIKSAGFIRKLEYNAKDSHILSTKNSINKHIDCRDCCHMMLLVFDFDFELFAL